MMGMPTPYVEPSLWYRRTCTGRPVAAGEPDGAGLAAEAGADDPPRQVPVAEESPHAADSTSAKPSAASTGANRNERRHLMTTTMLPMRPVRHRPAVSRMGGVFMCGVAGRLELEGGVLDVEVPGQALLQLVEQSG
jgi:hypothetical protein